jgi:hypothetical protein
MSSFKKSLTIASVTRKLRLKWNDDEMGAMHSIATTTPIGNFDVTSQRTFFITAAWGEIGCPTFTVSPNRWAVLGTTTAGQEVIESLIPPFRYFAILTDPGVVRTNECAFDGLIMVRCVTGAYANETIRLCKSGKYNVKFWKPSDADKEWSDDCYLWTFAIHLENGTVVDCGPWESRELIDKAGSFQSENSLLKVTDSDQRLMKVCARVIVGMCLSLDRRGNGFVGCVTNHRNGKPNRELASYDEFRITGSVSLDVRKQLSEHVCSGTGALHVHSLVRGHWKMQACGERMQQRKPVHILPYWRGPVDGPMALRIPR